LGLAGLLLGVGLGAWFLKGGYTLGRSTRAPAAAGWILPGFMVLLLVLVAFKVSFGEGKPVYFSTKGPGAMHPPLWISLAVGLAVGALAQRTRFCTVGAIRDTLLIRDFHLAWGAAAFVAAALAVNLVAGQFKAGFTLMPISHSGHLWNFLGMTLAGLAFALAGGCPGRQVVLAGEGDGDAAVFTFGMLAGAGFAHNFMLAAGPDKMVGEALKVGGPGPWGRVAVVLGLAFCVVLGFTARQRAVEGRSS
jgi:YedE family putative selenium metabolism protein